MDDVVSDGVPSMTLIRRVPVVKITQEVSVPLATSQSHNWSHTISHHDIYLYIKHPLANTLQKMN